MTVTISDEPVMNTFDPIIREIADFTVKNIEFSPEAYKTASLSLLDALGCAFLALEFRECTKLLGPLVPDTFVPHGARVPGTDYVLDPVQAAFNLGTMVRWLDYNDTWLAAEWGHPSDNIGGILAVADYQNHFYQKSNHAPLTIKKVLESIIKAHEIQGVLALNNSFNAIGLDHVILVKVASTAVCTKLLGGRFDDVCIALSHAWLDGHSLRTYRHSPNTGSRKSWAAGDATARAVWLAMMTLRGEMGYPTVMSTPTWGFHDVFFKGKEICLSQPLNSYIIENVLFKVAFPAEFHGQTAAECAIILHPAIKNRIDEIEKIDLWTHESALRIINKRGPLQNPADRDHCIQYIVAVTLLTGKLDATSYSDETAKNELIDILRGKITIFEDTQFSIDYLSPEKRSIANAMQITFRDGSKTEKVTIHYPLGHKSRRNEALPLLYQKFRENSRKIFPVATIDQLIKLFRDNKKLMDFHFNDFMDMLIP